ncbi:glycosyltransferase [Devosia sp.]|uniref:glycosyltransferase n=1 Tax=Devosia sp. TaxID=1871048 RepID=UPI00261B0DE2|nr:glycosyltransferase [Devosia sp.]
MFETQKSIPGRIVMLVRAFSGGGAQRDAVELANGLHRGGWPMAIATLDASGPLRALIEPDMTVIDLGQGRKRRMARAAPALVSMMRSLRPAVVIASEAAANGLLVLASQTLARDIRPRIVLREVASPVQALRADPYVQNRMAYRLAPLFYPLADRVLSLTEGVRQDLIARFGVRPERAINLGTNAVLTEARLADISQPAARRPGLIVGIGRLSPEKDFASLIAGFAALHEVRDVSLLILGEGPERAALERQVATLGLAGIVHLPGFVAEPLDYLREASLFVSTSRHEGFGNAIVEALACGVPVVATDAPHGPREILRDGALGTLVPLGDLCGLVDAMDVALDQPADPMPLQARAADFTTERAVARFADVLGGLGVAKTPLAMLEAAS